jgi:hypothetical protein
MLPIDNTKKELKHTSIIASIMYFLGVVSCLGGISLIFILQFELGLGLFISSFLLFALAELVYNIQFQTKLLLKIIEQKK